MDARRGIFVSRELFSFQLVVQSLFLSLLKQLRIPHTIFLIASLSCLHVFISLYRREQKQKELEEQKRLEEEQKRDEQLQQQRQQQQRRLKPQGSMGSSGESIHNNDEHSAFNEFSGKKITKCNYE